MHFSCTSGIISVIKENEISETITFELNFLLNPLGCVWILPFTPLSVHYNATPMTGQEAKEMVI